MGLSPEYSPFTFGMDPDEVTDPAVFFFNMKWFFFFQNFCSFFSEWYVHIQVTLTCELVQLDADPNLDRADSNMLDVGSDLIEWMETVGPLRSMHFTKSFFFFFGDLEESAFCFPEIRRQTSPLSQDYLLI